MQGGASVPDREATVRVLQGGVQRAEEKSHEILHAVYKRESFDVPASREEGRILRGIGIYLPFFENAGQRTKNGRKRWEQDPLIGRF